MALNHLVCVQIVTLQFLGIGVNGDSPVLETGDAECNSRIPNCVISVKVST